MHSSLPWAQPRGPRHRLPKGWHRVGGHSDPLALSASADSPAWARRGEGAPGAPNACHDVVAGSANSSSCQSGPVSRWPDPRYRELSRQPNPGLPSRWRLDTRVLYDARLMARWLPEAHAELSNSRLLCLLGSGATCDFALNSGGRIASLGIY
jgi:hypothetical protein